MQPLSGPFPHPFCGPAPVRQMIVHRHWLAVAIMESCLVHRQGAPKQAPYPVGALTEAAHPCSPIPTTYLPHHTRAVAAWVVSRQPSATNRPDQAPGREPI
jgi:hypothetical protein